MPSRGESHELGLVGGGRRTAGDDELNGDESGNLGFDRHLQSPSDVSAAVVARLLCCTEVFDFGLKVAP
jgi:hypothetical protein